MEVLTIAKEHRYYQQLTGYQKRFEYLEEARVKLMADILEAEVLWGTDIRKAYDALFRVVNELTVTIQMYLERLDPLGEKWEMTGDEQKRERRIMFAVPNEPIDEYSLKFQAQICEIEAFVRPHLEKYK